MRRILICMFVSMGAFIAGSYPAPAADVPDSQSSAGPALAAAGGSRVIIAWAGEQGIDAHKVWYSTYENDTFTPQTEIPGALTRTAPALATVDRVVYLATTPPNADDEIYYYKSLASDAGYFDITPAPLCGADTCAHTRAAPALVGNRSILYAAWTTPTGKIMYATRTDDTWHIFALAVPSAVTSPTTAPALAIYEGRLYVAWAAPSGEGVWVASATLPLSSASWSQPVLIPASTKVAPALGVFNVENPVPGAAASTVNRLYLAWTSDDATINFVRWDSASGQWQSAASPVSLPSGPLTADSPVLLGLAYLSPNMQSECLSNVGWTSRGQPHRTNLAQKGHTCPGVITGPTP
jgi:hypothetical protein